jgi:acid phosphatase (class A)
LAAVRSLFSQTRVFFAFVFLFLTACAGVARSAEAHYVAASAVDLTQLLAPPPAPGSPEERSDLDAVIAASRSRSPAEAEAALADGDRSVLRFADVMGRNFSARSLPFSVAFFEQVADDVHAIVATAKIGFDRLRPFAVDSRVAVLREDAELAAAPHHRSGSYPSGHSAFAYTTAVLLAAIVPEKASDIFVRADAFARNRIIAGAHFPTDVEGGRIAGTVIANVLLHDPRFMADFAKARDEIRHVLGQS